MYTAVSDKYRANNTSYGIISTARISVVGENTIIDSTYLKNLTLKDFCYDEETGELIGTNMAKTLEFTFQNKDNISLENKEISLELGLVLDWEKEIREFVPIGNFIVDSYEDLKSGNQYKVLAYDYLYKFNPNYKVDESIYPCTLKEFYHKLCKQYGVEYREQNNLPNENFNITKDTAPYLEGMTGRTILRAIGQLFGRYAKINRNNQIEWRLTNEHEGSLYPSTSLHPSTSLYPRAEDKEQPEIIDGYSMNSKLTMNNRYGPVNSVTLSMSQVSGENVTLEDKESIKKYGECSINFEDNPFVYTEALREQAISELYNALHGFTYTPVEFNYKGRFYLDCGDLIEVENVQTGEMVKSILLNHTINVPEARTSSISSKAMTSTAVKNKYISKSKQANTRTEINVYKNQQKIEEIIEENTETSNKLNETIKTLDETNSKISSVETKADNAQSTADKAQSTADNINKNLKNYSTTEEVTSQINQSANSVKEDVKSTYATKDELSGEVKTLSDKQSTLETNVDGINGRVSDIEDVSIQQEGTGQVTFTGINTSEPLMIKIHPTSTTEPIQALYVGDKAVLSDNLVMHDREIYFEQKQENGTYKKVAEYNLPDDLYYIDKDTYDEFVLDYDKQKCYVTKKTSFNTSTGAVSKITTKTNEYEYPSIYLLEGDYRIRMPAFKSEYLYVSLMKKTKYTTQTTTKIEMDSEIKQSAQAVEINVRKKINDEDLTGANLIAKINEDDTSEVGIKADKVFLEGYTSINGGFTIDEKGNATIANNAVKINEQGIQMASGTNIVGGNGMLTQFLYNSSGKCGFTEGTNVKYRNAVYLSVYVPSNFIVTNGNLIIIHNPAHTNIYNSNTGNVESHNCYVRNAKLYRSVYKASSDDGDFIVESAPYSPSELISNLGSNNGKTFSSSSTETMNISIDKNHFSQGIQYFYIADYIDNIPEDMINAFQMSGQITMELFLTGYVSS